MDDKPALRQSLLAVNTPRILVVGDMMLDRYSWGSVSRISPEAPIPVLRVSHEEHRPGGAANTMTNLSALGAKVWGCGLLGQDNAAELLKNLLQQQGVDLSATFSENKYATIVKHRMLSGHHHLLRMDYDPPEHYLLQSETKFIEHLQQLIPQMDLLILSDYGKGLLTENILNSIRSITKAHNKPVVVDPKRGADYHIYREFTAIKPNRSEAESSVGFPMKDKASILKAAEFIQQKYQIQTILISLDRDGLFLYENQNQHSFIEAEAHEVFDVVGAGDMVISVLSFLLAGKQSMQHAAVWANIAAGMEVQHVGVVSFSKHELLQKLELGFGSHKLIEAAELTEKLALQKLPVIFTNGYFDNISAGHLKFLQQLQKFKGVRVVAINSDKSIQQQKGQPPLLNQWERAQLLASIEAVDWVVIFDAPDASELLRQLTPSIVIKGERFRTVTIKEEDVIAQIGATLQYLPEYGSP